MMTSRQREYRQVAYVGFFFGFCVSLSFVILAFLGNTSSYAAQSYGGLVPRAPLFEEITAWEYPVLGGLLILSLLSYMVNVLFWALVRDALIPPTSRIFYNFASIFINTTAAISVVLSILVMYLLFFAADDIDRANAGRLGLVTIFHHNILVYLSSLTIAIGAYRAKTLDPRICFLMMAAELSLIIFDLIGLNPDVPSFRIIAGIFLGSIRNILLASYFLVLSLPGPGTQETRPL